MSCQALASYRVYRSLCRKEENTVAAYLPVFSPQVSSTNITVMQRHQTYSGYLKPNLLLQVTIQDALLSNLLQLLQDVLGDAAALVHGNVVCRSVKHCVDQVDW